MRNLIIHLASACITFLTVYGIVSFILWDLDLSQWDMFLRFFFVMASLLCQLGISALIEDRK